MSEPHDGDVEESETSAAPKKPEPSEADRMLHKNTGHLKDADDNLQQSRDDVDKASEHAKDALDE